MCLGFAPMAQAVGPDTDGSIPGSNNGEGIGVLVSRTAGVWNTGTGFEALNHLTGGNQNTATGLRALTSDTNGGFNTGTGVLSLFSNTSGFFNSATGAYALANNTDGNWNTANGYAALYRNTADSNTATGFAALYHNTTGLNNTATGYRALLSNTTGSANIASGDFALASNTTGSANTAVGSIALASNTDAGFNTALGFRALSVSTAPGNCAVGYTALANNTTGPANTGIGSEALSNNTTGQDNVAVGFRAGNNQTIGSSNVYIGAGVGGFAAESHHTYIRNIEATSVSGGGTDTVTINLTTGLLGHLSSSRRYKEDIKPMNNASETLYRLKPVSYRYKKEIDSTQSPAFGLIAEEVAEVNPDLVARNAGGQVESVHYEMVSAMLLNEFLKEHRKVEQQQVRITELNSRVAKQEAVAAQQEKSFQSKLAEQDKQIEALTSGLGKVSAQLEMRKSAPQVVSNNP
jgi:hypothetical protein